MNKKNWFLVMCLAAVAAFGCFAADAAPSAVLLNGVSHTIWVGKGASDSTVVIDSAAAPADGFVSFTFAATFTRATALKTLSLTAASADGFVPSGEIALAFPKNVSVRLYGKVAEKRAAGGLVEYALTFFAGLNELRDCCSSGQAGASLTLYAEDGQKREIALPGALFSAMPIASTH
jgi:hypothetical protein